MAVDAAGVLVVGPEEDRAGIAGRHVDLVAIALAVDRDGAAGDTAGKKRPVGAVNVEAEIHLVITQQAMAEVVVAGCTGHPLVGAVLHMGTRIAGDWRYQDVAGRIPQEAVGISNGIKSEAQAVLGRQL